MTLLVGKEFKKFGLDIRHSSASIISYLTRRVENILSMFVSLGPFKARRYVQLDQKTFCGALAVNHGYEKS